MKGSGRDEGEGYLSKGVALAPEWIALSRGSACTTFFTMLSFRRYAARASRLSFSASLRREWDSSGLRSRAGARPYISLYS